MARPSGLALKQYRGHLRLIRETREARDPTGWDRRRRRDDDAEIAHGFQAFERAHQRRAADRRRSRPLLIEPRIPRTVRDAQQRFELSLLALTNVRTEEVPEARLDTISQPRDKPLEHAGPGQQDPQVRSSGANSSPRCAGDTVSMPATMMRSSFARLPPRGPTGGATRKAR